MSTYTHSNQREYNNKYVAEISSQMVQDWNGMVRRMGDTNQQHTSINIIVTTHTATTLWMMCSTKQV